MVAGALLVVLMIGAGCTTVKTETKDNLTFYTEQYPPYNYLENGTPTGIMVDMLNSTMQEMGKGPVDIRVACWTSAYQTVLTTPNTVLFATSRTSDREQLFKWAGPVLTEKAVVFSYRERPVAVNSTDDLKRYRIGTVADDAAIGKLLTLGVPDGQIVVAADPLTMIKQVQNGTTDLFAYGEGAGHFWIGQAGTRPGLFTTVATIGEEPVYYAFNRNTSDQTVQAFQQALNKTTQKDLNRVLATYLPERGLAQLTYLAEEARPYNYEANGTVQGISVDLLNATLSRLDVPANATSVRIVPWTEGYASAQNNSSTVLFSTSRTPDRENLFLWAGPIGRNDYVLFADRTRNLSITNDTDLARYRIGAVTDDIAVQYLAAHGVPKDRLVLDANATSGIKRLASGEIDLFAYAVQPGHIVLNRTVTNPEQFQEVYTIGGSDFYYAFNRNVSPLLVSAFQHGLDDVKNQKDQSGVSDYERIMYRYTAIRSSTSGVNESQVTALINRTSTDLAGDATGTLRQINAGEAPYRDPTQKDLYVFVYDTNVTMVAHADNPTLVGQNYHNKTDVTGDPFRDRIVSGALKNTTGWVDYVYTNPTDFNLFTKTTYYRLVRGSDNQDYVVCAGTFKENST
jgi:polar amino acid transport system substrate-binding protein